MAAAVDESPVWKPRTTMTLTLATPSSNHLGNCVPPSTAFVHGNRGHDNETLAYGAYAADRKLRSDYTLSTFKPIAPGYGPVTWPRSEVKPTQSQSDPLLNRPNYSPSSPVSGRGLHPIREHLLETERPPSGGDKPPCPSAINYSTPSSRRQPTMKNGTPTTVPQNVVLASQSHRPSTRRSSRLSKLATTSRETWEVRCCRISVLLVIMQICLGVTVTALAFYMERLSSSIPVKECPYWAGIPLLMAGVLGIYFCATDFVAYSGSTRAFIIKALCFVLSTICVFLCMVAAVFPGIHGHRIPTYSDCKYTATNFTCLCVQPLDGFPREFQYNDIIDCVTVTTSVKDILILQCALNAVASGVCLWFVTLLWKKRYEQFHSGLRFYSYSASIPPHPWSDPSNPPYFKEQGQGSPLTIRKLSQRRNHDNQPREGPAQDATLF